MTHRPAPFPFDDAQRLAALEDLNVLDSLSEPMFDDIVALASQICQTPISLVSLVDRDRQWFKARVGLDATETHRDMAFCGHAILAPDQLMLVEDAMQDPRFCESPLVLGAPHIRFYAGAPIVTPEGYALGTVCVIDTVARTLDEGQCKALSALARQTASLLQLRELSALKTAQALELKRKVTEAMAEDGPAHSGLRRSHRVASIGQLTSGIAHDFNNLLQTINASLQLIDRKAEVPAQVRRWAASGLEAVGRGARLTAQLLAFSRDQSPELQSLNVAEHLNSMTELLARALGPEVRVQVELGNVAAHVMGDSSQLESAVLNLAINARDAMNGVGHIGISTRLVNLQGDAELPDGEYLQLTVSDDGPGMPSAVAARAFDPFVTTKEVGKGTGLGLAQVAGFAMKSGGLARIHSEPNAGTSISLWLKTVGDDKPPVASCAPITQAASVSTDTRVLLVDDDTANLAALAELLAFAGYQVEAVTSGQDALESVSRRAPDVILTDCAMHGLGGVALAERLREVGAVTPILFMTGHIDIATVTGPLGPDAVVLQKPLLLEQVCAGIERVLGHHAASR
jgi:signal transduction histidine kinase/ActR/RegA family two-component response regulator